MIVSVSLVCDDQVAEVECSHVDDSDPPIVKNDLISAAILSSAVMDVVVPTVLDMPTVLVMVLVTGVVPSILFSSRIFFSVSLTCG